MNIHQFLLSLGTASFIALPASTAVFADADRASNPTGHPTAAADTSGLTRSTAMSVVPSPGLGGPPAIYFPAIEEQRVPAADREQNRDRVMQAVVSPNGVPTGIAFSDPAAERPRLNLRNGEPQEPVLNVVVAANGGIPTGINIAARDDSQFALDDTGGAMVFGAPAREIDDPLDFVQNASALLEYEIQNKDGERLGTVHDFIMDQESGRVELVAAGSGSDLRLIPPQALEPVAGESHIVLDLESDRWEEAPTVSPDELNDVALAQDAPDIYEFYGLNYRPAIARAGRSAEPRERATRAAEADEASEEREELAEAAAEAGGPSLRNPRLQQTHRGSGRTPQQSFSQSEETEFGAAERDASIAETQERTFWASDILGAEVEAEVEPIGVVDDLIIDLHVGYLQHVIVSRSNGAGQSYAIPLHDLNLTEEGAIRLLREPATLDEAPEFDARMARLRRYEPFRYDPAETPQYGAPDREAEAAEPDSENGAQE